jgi:nucleoside-diphosphate-sugar epimerase
MQFPERFADVSELENYISQPTDALIDMMRRLDGDIMILGVAGKMGVTMAMQAANAVRAAGVRKDVIGVARFSDASLREKLERSGVKTIACDLLDQAQISQLPQIRNIIFMAGRKFGTQGGEDLTWAMNVLAPAYVADHFKKSRITAFSTGCVYPLVSAEEGGCTEDILPEPVGEYSQSCLGRERVLQYASRMNQTPMLLFRLNYAIDLRYGVLHDIAMPVWRGEKVNNAVSHFNAIWQGCANEAALRSLELASCPVDILNVTGPETVSTEDVAEEFGRLFGKKVEYMYPVAGRRGYLNNASRMFELFGKPSVSMEQMIKWQAQWIMSGGESLNKPTHFEVNNGKF